MDIQTAGDAGAFAAWLDAVFAVTGQAVAAFAESGDLVAATPAARVLLGLGGGTLVGAASRVVDQHGRALRARDNPVLSALAGAVVWPARMHWRRDDGDLCALLVFARRVELAEGGLVARLYDPDAGRPMPDYPDEISRAGAIERVVRVLAGEATVAVAVVDADERLVASNRAFAEVLGADAAGLGQRPTTAELLVLAADCWDPALLRECLHPLVASFDTGAPADAEVARRTGERFRIATAPIGAGLRLYTLHGAPADEADRLRQQGHDRDLAVVLGEHNQAMAAIEAAQEREAELHRMKGQLVSAVSHELKNPLNTLLGYLELLTEGVYAEPDEARHFARRAHESATELHRLINQVLDLGRVQSGQVRTALAAVPLALVAAEAGEPFRPAATAKGLVIRVPEPGDSPRALADERQLAQALGAVVDNAVRFTDAGVVELRVGQDGQGAWIEVRDSGIGLRPELCEQVLEPFVQGDAGPRRRHGGLGLGLTIARGLVQAMHGRLSLRSEGPGTGCTVRIELPAVQEP